MANDYLLLTPGPLSTSEGVKNAMLKDWCTWDDDYNVNIVQTIRHKLIRIATKNYQQYTSVLMQGSGTFAVESVLGSCLRKTDKPLVINNGSYGSRLVEILNYYQIDYCELKFAENQLPDLDLIKHTLESNVDISHILCVHCETTSGILNPIAQIGQLANTYDKTYIVDAMSSFGGIPLDMDEINIDFLISSANKCIQGVPGFGFIIAKRNAMQACKNNAKSLSLDLYKQWLTMEESNGKWRFTSATHTVYAFYQALIELEKEGGVAARYQRYQENQMLLVNAMLDLGFACLVPLDHQSCIITSFYSPQHAAYNFKEFYQLLKSKGFVIYPGKVSTAYCFRIGNIGEIYPQDIIRLINAIRSSMYWCDHQNNVVSELNSK